MAKIVWGLPIKTVSEANCSQHWAIKRKRHKVQQMLIRSLFNGLAMPIVLPCVVKLFRLGTRPLDDDNLRTAFKWIRDEVSECLIPEKRSSYVAKNGRIRQIKGRADSDPRIEWHYFQEKSHLAGIRIEIDY